MVTVEERLDPFSMRQARDLTCESAPPRGVVEAGIGVHNTLVCNGLIMMPGHGTGGRGGSYDQKKRQWRFG